MYRMKVLETWVGGDLKGRAHARLFCVHIPLCNVDLT